MSKTFQVSSALSLEAVAAAALWIPLPAPCAPRGTPLPARISGCVVHKVETFYILFHFLSYGNFRKLSAEHDAMLTTALLLSPLAWTAPATTGGAPWTASSTWKAATDQRNASSVPHFTLSLDEDPAHRWDAATPNMTQYVPAIMDYLKSEVPSWALPILEVIGASVRTYFGPEYGAEMEGVAKVATEGPARIFCGPPTCYPRAAAGACPLASAHGRAIHTPPNCPLPVPRRRSASRRATLCSSTSSCRSRRSESTARIGTTRAPRGGSKSVDLLHDGCT